MKSVYTIALFLLAAACSNSEGFKGDGATGSVKSETKDAEPEPSVAGPSLPPPARAPAPKPEPLLDACKSAAVKSIEETISFAENAQGCDFGNGINQDRLDGTVTAVETSTASLRLPAGRICEIGLETLSATQMRYDDMMVFAIDSNVVFASTLNILPFLEKSGPIYSWDPVRLIGRKMDFAGAASCIGGKGSCVIPPTDQSGPFSVKVPPERFEPISLAISGKTDIPVTLSVTGDNDDSDCSHSAVDMKVSIKYVP